MFLMLLVNVPFLQELCMLHKSQLFYFPNANVLLVQQLLLYLFQSLSWVWAPNPLCHGLEVRVQLVNDHSTHSCHITYADGIFNGKSCSQLCRSFRFFFLIFFLMVPAKNIVWKNLFVSHLGRESCKIKEYFAVCLIIVPYGQIKLLFQCSGLLEPSVTDLWFQTVEVTWKNVLIRREQY